MKKSKIYEFLFLIIGFIFAEVWRHLLRGVHISEFFKLIMGIVIIVITFFVISKVISLSKK